MATSPVTAKTVQEALTAVEDPEIPINIVDLGLVYGVEVDGARVEVEMTLTSLACPAEDLLREDVVECVEAITGVESASVEIVWDPPWTADRLSPDARDQLREFGITG